MNTEELKRLADQCICHPVSRSTGTIEQAELAAIRAREPVAITPLSQAMQMYAKHPTYRGTRALSWLEAPQGVRDEWLQKVGQK